MNRQLPAVLVAVAYTALVIGSWGFISLLRDDDVIHYADAGPLLGPSMAVAATLTTWGWVVRVRKVGAPVVAGVAAAASAWLAMLIVGAAGYTVTKGVLAWLLFFPASYALSAFTLVPAAIAGAIVAVAGAFSARARSFARPRRKD